ncbi:MAG: GFA family protein, partial [Cognatishimia sp.]|nr:GFA family protein [Cognatishimia sp.]
DDFKVAKHIFAKDKGCYYDINDPVTVLDSY